LGFAHYDRKRATMYDKFEQIAFEAQLAVCVLANEGVTDIELVNLRSVPLPTPPDFTGRNLHFLGVIGVVQGVPRTALAEPLDPVRISALSAAFIRYCEVLLDAGLRPKDDFVRFAEALWSLPDTRD
jgi:hypothetical protein